MQIAKQEPYLGLPEQWRATFQRDRDSSPATQVRSRRVVCERLERDASLDYIEERRIQSCRLGYGLCPTFESRLINQASKRLL